jgi:hypothetical protein
MMNFKPFVFLILVSGVVLISAVVADEPAPPGMIMNLQTYTTLFVLSSTLLNILVKCMCA